MADQSPFSIVGENVPFESIANLPGFDGRHFEGTSGKFLGSAERDLWVYHFKNEPGVVIPVHQHNSRCIHYIMKGSWEVDGEVCHAGYCHVEWPNEPYGPIRVGPEGVELFLVYEQCPGSVGLAEDGSPMMTNQELADLRP